MMLVDGGVMDNAPLAPLQDIKLGPNLVVHFGRTGEQRFDCRYEDIPGRGKLIAALLNPFARKRLPRAPNAFNVLWRSLLAHQRYELPLDAHDLLLRPPQFPGGSFMGFEHHAKVVQAAYVWASSMIDELAAQGNDAIAAILASRLEGDAGVTAGAAAMQGAG
jgi:NTE family protein